jgi:hypothetical protein
MARKSSKKDPTLINIGEPIEGETCFNVHKECFAVCLEKECRYWQDMNGSNQNCIINASNSSPLTLQEVGNIFSVTRMRICQIEKSAKEILKGIFEKSDRIT